MRRRQDDRTFTTATIQGQQGLENPSDTRATQRHLRSLYYMAPPLLFLSSGVILMPEIHAELVSFPMWNEMK